MIRKPLLEQLEAARNDKRRLVVPLLGFPGLTMTGSTIKIAQQNYGEHFRVIKALSQKFQADAAFPLMDLAVEANALGLYTVFPKNESATVMRDAFSVDALAVLHEINISFDTRLLGYVETLKLMNLGLPDAMIRGAYVIGPYTLAALLMGADEAAMATVMQPGNLRKICEFTTEVIQKYVRQLIAAGAQIVCILEPSAVMLSPDQFWDFSADFIRHINDSVQYSHASTIYHTCGNTMHLLDKMVQSGVGRRQPRLPGRGRRPARRRTRAPAQRHRHGQHQSDRRHAPRHPGPGRARGGPTAHGHGLLPQFHPEHRLRPAPRNTPRQHPRLHASRPPPPGRVRR